MSLDSSAWVWLPLLFAILSGLTGRFSTSFIGLGVALIAGFFEQRISVIGFTTALMGLGIAVYIPKLSGWYKRLALLFFLAWSFGLALHLLPGFHNLKVLDAVTSGPNSLPFSLYINLDKPLIFFALLLAYPKLLGEKKQVLLTRFSLSLILTLALLPLAVVIGKLGIEVTIPHWWWLFAINNLLLTCVVEEAIFRGFLQQELSGRFGWKVGLVIASTLFGIAHVAGGAGLVIFASLAGLGYGLAFHLTGRLWVAIVVHFLFNFLHLLFFTYPLPAVT